MNPESQEPAVAPQPAPQPPMDSATPPKPESDAPRTSGSTKWLMIALAVVIVAAVIYILVK